MKKLVAAVRAQIVLQAVRIAQQFILLGAMLKVWGADGYGDWVLLSSTAAFVVSLDFGIQSVVSNNLLMQSRGESPLAIQKTVNDFISYYTLFIPIAIVTTFIISRIGLELYGLVPTGTMSAKAAADLLFLIAAGLLVNVPITVMGSIYAAYGDVARGIDRVTMQSLVQLIVSILLLNLGVSQLLYAEISLFVSVGFLFLVRHDILRRYQPLTISPHIKRVFSCLLYWRIGVVYLINPLANTLVQSIPVYFLAHSSNGAAAVAMFSVARTLAGLARQLITQIANAMAVEILRTWQADNSEDTALLYGRADRFIGAASGIVCAAVCIMGPDFIPLWTGGRIFVDKGLLYVIVLTFLFLSPCIIPMSLLNISNNPGSIAISLALQAIFCLISVTVLGHVSIIFVFISFGLAEVVSLMYIRLRGQATYSFVTFRLLASNYLYGAFSFFCVSGLLIALRPKEIFLTESKLLLWCAVSTVPIIVTLYFSAFAGDMRSLILVSARKILRSVFHIGSR